MNKNSFKNNCMGENFNVLQTIDWNLHLTQD